MPKPGKLLHARNTSRRAYAVETGGMIRPLRIAKVDRAVGESAGLQRYPARGCQIGVGFHCDGYISCPCDVETEAIGQNSEVAIDLRLRVPQHRPNMAVRGERSPARGPWQVIDSQVPVVVDVPIRDVSEHQ